MAIYTPHGYRLALESRRRRASYAIEQWEEEQRPALMRIRDKLQALLDELKTVAETRDLGYGAETAAALRAYASDAAKGGYDFLTDMQGRLRNAADDEGAPLDQLRPLDLSELEQDCERLS